MSTSKITLLSSLAALLWLSACTPEPGVKVVKGFPDQEQGYEQGVSACFAAQIGHNLVVAGGANFADTPAAEGGTKCYYSGIYGARCSGDSLAWEQFGSLPEPLAYGVAISNADSLMVIGGCNADGPSKLCYSIHVEYNRAFIRKLSALPEAIDNAAGCCLDHKAYVVGGNENGAPSAKIYCRDLLKRYSKWKEFATMPQARVQPVCAALDSKLMVWGGFTPAGDSCQAVVHTDGLMLDLATGQWSEVAAPMVDGKEITLAGGSMAALNDHTIMAFGGVNSDIFADAISGQYALVEKDKYLLQPAEWYRFNSHLLTFDVTTMQWTDLGTYPSLARAGAAIAVGSQRPAVKVGSNAPTPVHELQTWCVGGESKPGIRAPEVTRIILEKEQK